MKSYARSRRTFLKAVGVSAAALPFYHLLERSAVGAPAGPKNFIGVYVPHGMPHPLWTMQPGDTETNFDLTFADCPLSPFDDAATYGESFKDKLLLIDGIDLSVGVNGGVAGHDASPVLFTGTARPNGPSMDQYLAHELGLGASNPFGSLAVGVDVEWALYPLSRGPTGAPIEPIVNPADLFDTVFAKLIVGDDPEAKKRAETELRRGKSVIDMINADIASLKPKLHPEEQRKLDQHLTSVREIEKRLEGFAGGATCTKPERPSQTLFHHWESGNYAGPEDEYFNGLAEMQIDLIAQAIACDLTRFATIYLPHRLKSDHHGVVHAYTNRLAAYNDATFAPLAEVNRWNYAQCARLMQKLSEYGVLDDTLLYITSDMGDPSEHNSRYVPTILAGGAGGAFRMGRRIRVGADCDVNAKACYNDERVPNNKVLVSIAQAFGGEVDSFGYDPNFPEVTQGSLDGLV